VQALLLADARPLLVLARHHLAEQSEREELEADDDEQYAEEEQRAMPDRLTRGLQNGQVGEDDEADGAEQEAESSEQVQRPVPVPPDERHGEEVEEAAQVTLTAVAGSAVRSRAMLDGQLRDPVAAVVREHRQEAMQLSVDAEASEHLGSVCLQPAVEVVQPQSRDAARGEVEDSGQGSPQPWVAPLRLPARDEVEALLELREQPRDLGGNVLQVGVYRHDDVAVGLGEAGGERGRLPEVAAETDDANVVLRGMEARERCEAAVARAVVDEDGFPRDPEWLQSRHELLVQESERQLLVVDGNDDRDHAVDPSATSVSSDVSGLLSIEEAQRLVLEHAQALESEPVPLEQAAGRILAEPARAVVDLPPFASSAMDGFAVRSADTPGRLRIADVQAAAGSPAASALDSGHAIAIATGGVVPEGADAVVPIEEVVKKDNSIHVEGSIVAGENVRPRGGDAHSGDVVVEAGNRIGAAQIGALAAAGVAEVACALRPRASVIATGSELRRPGEPLEPGQIYEANGVMLAAQLESAGAVVASVRVVADDAEAHRRALEAALECDLVLSSGGVSVGPHDLVRSVAAELGVEEVFWRVAVKPGKPLWFGTRGRTLVLGLPGNPVSSLVGFEVFVRPALLALQGAAEPRPEFAVGVLARPARRNSARDEFVRARRTARDGAVELEALAGQESHMIARAALADALVHIPRGEGDLPAGTPVRYLTLR
jgi:molybdopterin molybdotransferase